MLRRQEAHLANRRLATHARRRIFLQRTRMLMLKGWYVKKQKHKTGGAV